MRYFMATFLVLGVIYISIGIVKIVMNSGTAYDEVGMDRGVVFLVSGIALLFINAVYAIGRRT